MMKNKLLCALALSLALLTGTVYAEEVPAATDAPAETPVVTPTDAPTQAPTDSPTEAPMETPTDAPTEAPTDAPTDSPTKRPTKVPTKAPTTAPTARPTRTPSDEPLVLVDRLILVNKTHDLDRDYVPDDLVVPDVRFKDGIGDVSNQMSEPAARALEAMFDAALADGITLVGMSGYRSYGMQAYIYETRLKEHGLEHVSKYNAKPGQSEHQTGLAMDLSSPDCMVLNTWFDTTDAFKWLSEHCAEYGFIIRYPKGLEEETGYAYEPWHVRYVGSCAQEIMDRGLSFEAYLDLLEAGDDPSLSSSETHSLVPD